MLALIRLGTSSGVCLLVEGRGSRVTSRGSRVNGRGSRVNGRGSKNSSQLLLNVVKSKFHIGLCLRECRCLFEQASRGVESKD